ncbi:hypothetical protein K431DRAFT_290543 [Polychaeton citri CBS 116435]|uniref:Zn(2)-C6 fungal-type domain-containing protein n=1 Tax=Polychaeton citri CBS 116435 TaxID=1314669 RepID=A0A9P4QID1_9PEZI|nr:hypothetical protein K431DRAFT_290543 [Polychaeton citri CBS 116435]
MPLRSTGCATCRKRKIRCDEGRPGCKRCATHGVPCPGYRGEKAGGIEFEDQTSITVKRASAIQQKLSTSRRSPGKLSPGSSGMSVSQYTNGSRLFTQTGGYFMLWPMAAYSQESGLGGGSIPTPVRSPSVERTQLYDKFVEGYVPQGPGKRSLHFDYIRLLVDAQETHQSLKDGLDALSLVHVGSQLKDQRLVQQAIKAYSRSLIGLGRAIEEGQALTNDSVLAAATVLSVCEFYDEIKLNGLGWMGHQNGLGQLLAARGPDSLKTDLALMLFFNARHGALAQGLITRKLPLFAQANWRACAFRIPVPDHSTTFYDLAIQIPGMLERHDLIDLASPTALQSLTELLADCGRLEFDFRNWEIGWQTRFRVEQRKPYWLQKIEDFELLPQLVPDRKFNEGYMFHQFLEAYMFNQYWQCMHFLRECVESLQLQRQLLDPTWLPDPGTEVTFEELNEYVLHLCRSLPYMCEPETSISGHVAIFLPIRVAAFHFKKHNMWEWLRWIWAVRATIFNRGVSQPNVGDAQTIAAGQIRHVQNVQEMRTRP